MQGQFFEYIFLILVILGLVMLANKVGVAYPIVLVLGGLGLSVFSAFSEIRIDPDLIFFIFLPPLLYEAAWQVSWKEFWRWKRVIMSFAFPIVILTSCVVAFASTALIPGFTLALGFLLGGIISPPDAVSATAILSRIKVPRTLLSIIEGESLLNDASSLIVFRFALVAVATGQFRWEEAGASFLLVVTMGVIIGLAVGGIFYAIHRWMPTTSSVDIVLTLVTPYCMYYAAEHFHYSGVLAVVSGGLLLSFRRQQILTYQSRLQGVNVWNSLVFVLNGIVFLLIGLQMPSIIGQLGDIGLGTAIGYGLAISLLLVVTRLICTLGASVFTRFMSNFITVAEANPGWRGPLLLGWAGMRGVVSLAAALSIPLMLSDGRPFPFRALILFITFIVILVTLVFQGLTLPWLVRKLHMPETANHIPEEKQDLIIQKKLAKYGLEHIEATYSARQLENEHVKNLRARLSLDMNFFDRELGESTAKQDNALKGFQAIYLEVLEQQRLLLDRMNHHAEFDEELIRKHLGLIDMEEFKLREKLSLFGEGA